MNFLNLLICFGLGCFVTSLVSHNRLSKKKTEPKINQLQSDNNQLQLDKTNLQNRNMDLLNRNSDLGKTIIQNKKEIKEIKGDMAILASKVVLVLDLIGGITRIQHQNDVDINAEITIAKGFQKKYERFYPSE